MPTRICSLFQDGHEKDTHATTTKGKLHLHFFTWPKPTTWGCASVRSPISDQMEILGLCLLFTWMTSIVVSAVSVDQASPLSITS